MPATGERSGSPVGHFQMAIWMLRGRRLRAGALLLAVLVQVAGVALLLLESRSPRRVVDAEPVLIHIEPLLEFAPPPLPAASPPDTDEQRRRRQHATVAPASPAIQVEVPRTQVAPAADRSITPSPDWYAGAPDTAARHVEREAAAASNRLDSKPEVMDLPAREPPVDRVTRLDNGDVEFRSGNIVCTYTRPPMGLESNEWARHIPPRCGYRPLPSTSFAEEFDRKLAEKKPGYLKPRPPQGGTGTGSNVEEPQ
jgi:hypothetical protein